MSYNEYDDNSRYVLLEKGEALFNVAKEARPFVVPGAVILEPVMKVEITTPEQFMGDINGNLASKRGMVEGMDDRDMVKVIRVTRPRLRLAAGDSKTAHTDNSDTA